MNSSLSSRILVFHSCRTNYQKLSGLKQHPLINSQFWISENWADSTELSPEGLERPKSRCQPGWATIWGGTEELLSHFETPSPEDPLRGVFSVPSQLSINVFDVCVFMGFCPSHHYRTSSILLVLVIKPWDLWQQSLCFIHLCFPRASHGSWHVVSAW